MKKLFLELKIIPNLNNRDNIISYDLNYQISSFLYHNFIGEDVHNITRPKGFTFSLVFDSYTNIKGKGFKLDSDRALLIVSSVNEEIINKIIRYESNYTYNIEKLYFNIVNHKVDEDVIVHNMLHLRTISPICINKKNIINEKIIQRFSTPNDSDYIELLKKNIIAKNGFKNCNVDVHIIQETIKPKDVKLKFNQTIKAFMFDFFIKIDDLETLNKNYFSGFGVKNSQGFGMVEILNRDNNV